MRTSKTLDFDLYLIHKSRIIYNSVYSIRISLNSINCDFYRVLIDNALIGKSPLSPIILQIHQTRISIIESTIYSDTQGSDMMLNCRRELIFSMMNYTYRKPSVLILIDELEKLS